MIIRILLCTALCAFSLVGQIVKNPPNTVSLKPLCSATITSNCIPTTGADSSLPIGTTIIDPVSGVATPRISVPYTVGAGGVTAGTFVKLSTSVDKTVIAAAASEAGVLGIATDTVSSGGTVYVATRGRVNCVASTSFTHGDLVGIDASTPSGCLDLNATLSSQVLSTVQIVGRATESGLAGSREIHYYGPGHYGTMQPPSFRSGLRLDWVDADTISVSTGGCSGTGTSLSYAGGNITFAALDTGARTLGTDYAAFLTPDGIKLTAIAIYHASGLIPSGYTAANSCLLGWFHNGKSVGDANALGAIFEYSVVSSDLLNRTRPYRALKGLPAGVPLPGMVQVGSIAVGIYEASREDATSSAAGSSSYPVSRYGVVPFGGAQGWEAMQMVTQSGCRLPTWAEWLSAATAYPGSQTPARLNGNTAYGSASDAAYLSPPGAPTAGVSGSSGITGAYKYLVTLVNAAGETLAGTATGTVNPSSQQVDLTAIPTGATGTTARKLYRTTNGAGTYKLLATLADNSTTVYTDTTADGSLGALPPAWNTTGAQQGVLDPTTGGRTLTGTGPRTSVWGSSGTGRSWYSPLGIADAVGNTWEWVSQFFGGLKTSSPGTGVAWGFEGDYIYNLQGQSYNPDTGGWTDGLPSLLIVGGGWISGSYAGVRSANANNSPGIADSSLGFRLAR